MTIPRRALFLIRCNTIHQSGSRRFRTEAPQILFEKKGHVAKLTLNRPSAANAMGSIIMQEFNHIMEDLEGCIETRSVILTSCSQKVFSAGADLKERAGMTPIEAQATVNNLRTSLQRFASLPMPTMAVVEGVAVGGGMELAVAADFIIASRTSIFGMPETALGIIPGAGGTQRVPRLVGISRALELAVTARRFDGQAAYDYGIVQHLVEPGTADDKAMKLALQIARNAPIAVRAAKEAIKRGMSAPTMQAALHVEGECYARTIVTNDRLEGLAAFKEGRTPNYKGD